MKRYRVLVAQFPGADPIVGIATRWRWVALLYAWLYCQVYAWGEAVVQTRAKENP